MTFLVCIHIDEKGRAGCFAFIVFQMSCCCKCFVAVPHGAVGWSAVCDCVLFFIILTYFSQFITSVEVSNMARCSSIPVFHLKC